MPGPGGKDVNKVNVKVVPDTSKFAKKLKAQLERIEAQMSPIEIQADVELNTAKAKAQMAALEKQLGGNITKTVNVRGTAAAVQGAQRVGRSYSMLGRIARKVAAPLHLVNNTVRVTGDASKTLASHIGRAADKTWNMSRGMQRFANHTLWSRDNLRDISHMLRNDSSRSGLFRGIRSGARMLTGAVAQIGSLVGMIAAPILDTMKEAFSGFGKSLSGFSKIASPVVTGLGMIALAIGAIGLISAIVTPLVLGLAGAIMFLAGGIGAGLAGLPIVIAAIAGPIAAIALGIDGINAAVGNSKKRFTELNEYIGATFEKGLTPVIRSFADLLLGLKEPLNDIAKSIVGVAQGFATFFSSDKGSAAMKKTLEGVAVSTRLIGNGLLHMTKAFFTVTANTKLFRILGQTIQGITAAWSNWIVKVSQDGRLQQALRHIQELLISAMNALIGLMDNALTFFNAGAPGMNAFINALTSFFSRWDWEALGKMFGRFFQTIADKLQQMPQEKINELVRAIIAFSREVLKFIENGGIFDVIASIKGFIRTGEKAWNMLQRFGGKIDSFVTQLEQMSNFSLWDWLTWGLKGVLNFIIMELNDFIDMINWITGGISWISEKIGWGAIPEIPHIPALADGGVVDGATVALIGEAGPEAVIPLDKLDSMLREVKSSGGPANQGPATEINIGEVRAHDYNDFRRQMGRRALTASIPGGGSR